MAGPNRILLIGETARKHDEASAAGTITPGFLIKHDANGAVVAHSTAYGGGELMVAIENGLQGKMVSDNYVTGDKCFFHRPMRGDVLWMLLKATGGTAAIDSDLASAGDGKLIVTGAATGAIKFKSMEAIPQAASDQRIRVRVP